MREEFVSKSFKPATLAVIEQANAIIEAYQEQGFRLTLRQLYYQFVARDLIPNQQTEYKRLGSIVNDARLAGLMDWDAIEDRTRHLRALSTWDTPADVIRSAYRGYSEDLWASQPHYVEVWIEKDALLGVVEGVCDKLRVPYFACRGYASQSELYSAGKRLADYSYRGQSPIVLHFGDHDPSGIDMTRDNEERLSMFAGEPVEVRRLALNMPQIRQYRPPPNPAKDTDARFAGYVQNFGTKCWELDALDPNVIATLIRREVEDIRNPDAWEAALAAENKSMALLRETSRRWNEVAAFLGEPEDEEE